MHKQLRLSKYAQRNIFKYQDGLVMKGITQYIHINAMNEMFLYNLKLSSSYLDVITTGYCINIIKLFTLIGKKISQALSLTIASKRNYTEIVDLLLKHNAPIYHNAIYWSCRNGHTEIVDLLLKHNAPIDHNAIYWSCRNGYIEIVDLLLKHNAPIDHNAINWSCQNGYTEIVNLLLKHNAPMDQNVLKIANEENNIEISKLLIKHMNKT
jgi:ankyrin repeat protein